jgi:hypothetical protein
VVRASIRDCETLSTGLSYLEHVLARVRGLKNANSNSRGNYDCPELVADACIAQLDISKHASDCLCSYWGRRYLGDYSLEVSKCIDAHPEILCFTARSKRSVDT